MAWGLGGLDLTLASAGRFLHLCCCQLQRLQLCIQEWYHGFSAFLGRVSGWRADSLHFRPRLKDLFLTHGSATRVPRNIQVDWMEWIEEEMIRELHSPRSCQWRRVLYVSHIYFWILLNSVPLSDDIREDRQHFWWMFVDTFVYACSLESSATWGLIEAAESLTSRRTQEQNRL